MERTTCVLNGRTVTAEVRPPQSYRYGREETVLVIEDHDDLNRALATRLELAGFRVVSAYDGRSGLERFRELQPSLVILDLNLPRLHGRKLLHELRMSAETAHTVVITGDPDPRVEERVRGLGVRHVFRKPLRHREVVHAACDLLDGYDA